MDACVPSCFGMLDEWLCKPARLVGVRHAAGFEGLMVMSWLRGVVYGCEGGI